MSGGRKRGAPAPRPRSGFVTEEQRGTKRIYLRPTPEIYKRAKALAEKGITLARIFEAGVEALERSTQA